MALPEFTFNRVDIPPINYPGKVIDKADLTEFSPEFQRWLGNLVDVINEALTEIENNLEPPFLKELIWNVVTDAAVNLQVQNGYLANRNSLVMMTLPTTCLLGDTIRVAQMNPSGSFMISQNAGQQIQFGAVTTTLGTGGSITSTAVGDSLELLCTVPDTNFIVLSMMGNPTFI